MNFSGQVQLHSSNFWANRVSKLNPQFLNNSFRCKFHNFFRVFVDSLLLVSFCKHLSALRKFKYSNKMAQLTKIDANDSWGQCYKTFLSVIYGFS
jgi:hypothetical protein